MRTHTGRIHGRKARILSFTQFDALAMTLQPLAIGMCRFELRINIFRQQEFSGFQVGRHHLARAHAALGRNVVRATVIPHTHFRRDGDEAVFGNHITRWTQTIAVQHAHAIAAVGHDDTGRAVPRLHVHRVVFVEGPQIGIHIGDVLPCRRHHHAHGTEQAGATHDQTFEHVVEGHGIGTLDADHGPYVFHIRNKRALEFLLTRTRPVTVALHGIDLTVMGQVAERLCQTPFWPGVGGKALVEHGQRRFKTGVAQVGVEHRQPRGHDQALVRHDTRRQRGDIERAVISSQSFFNATTRNVELALEDIGINAVRAIDEQMLNNGHALQGHFTQRAIVGRRCAEPRRLQPFSRQFSHKQITRTLRFGFFTVKKNQASGISCTKRNPCFGRDDAHETIRHLEEQTATVTRLAIGRHGATMGHAGQRRNGVLHQLVARLVVQLGNQAKATTVLLKIRAV